MLKKIFFVLVITIIGIYSIMFIQDNLNKNRKTETLSKYYKIPTKIEIHKNSSFQSDFNLKCLSWFTKTTKLDNNNEIKGLVDQFFSILIYNCDLQSWYDIDTILPDNDAYNSDLRDSPFVKNIPLHHFKRQLEKKINDGNSSPLLFLSYGHVLCWMKEYTQAKVYLLKAYQEFETNSYPSILTFICSRALAVIFFEEGLEEEEVINRWVGISLNHFSNSIIDREFLNDDSQFAYRILSATVNDPFSEKKWDYVYTKISSYPVDPWLLKMIEGQTDIQKGWEARGYGFAKDVSDEGWRVFKKNLSNASTVLSEAWKMKPNYPESSAAMIVVAMLGHSKPHESERVWFDRSVKAQFDYSQAYRNYIHSLNPQWGGSYKEMIAFGAECIDTLRFDTEVPLYYLDILRTVGSKMPNFRWRYPFRQEGVSTKLDILFNGMLSQTTPGTFDFLKIKTQQGLSKAWCGEYQAAKDILSSINQIQNLKNGFQNNSLSYRCRDWAEIETELSLFNGPNKKMLINAEKTYLSGNINGALPIFKKVLSHYSNSDQEYTYLREIMALIKMGHSSEEIFGGALHAAVRYNHLPTVKWLLENGDNINRINRHGWAPIHYALYNKQFKISEYLLEQNDINVNLETLKKKYTPLHLALNNGMPEIASKIIHMNANINSLTVSNWSPLHYALYNKHVDVASELIAAGANINEKNSIGWSPLHYALNNNLTKIAEVLVNKGADVNCQNNKGWAPLHFALYNNQPEIIPALIIKGADVNAKNNINWSPLHYALRYNHINAAKLLIEEGADVNSVNSEGWAPIHLATYYNITKMTKILLESGANKNLKLNDGRTPLQIARGNNNTKIIKLLMKSY